MGDGVEKNMLMKYLHFNFFCVSFFLILSKTSFAADTIGLNRSISDSQTLVSSNQNFELGFFSRGKSKNRYLGIWYKEISQTVVWVANRNDPLTDLFGVLTVREDGNVVLLNQDKSVVWSSNLSRKSDNPVLQLLNSGNLVLEDGNSGSYLWQSFDYPGDTLMPGMKLGWNLRAGENWPLTSWKNMDDPSPGDYSWRMDISELPQLFLRKRSTTKFRTGAWNGLRFSGVTYFKDYPNYRSLYVSNSDGVYYMTTALSDNSIAPRIIVNQSGTLQRLVWSKQALDWVVMSRSPIDQCDNYAQCGPNSICTISKSASCDCLPGFAPKSPIQWSNENWFRGCKRRVTLDCEKGDKFVAVKEVKLPDTLNFWTNKSLSLQECEVECLKNCSCTAYANSDITGQGSGCILWFEDLIDVRKFIDKGKQDLYVRLAASEVGRTNKSDNKKRRVLMIVILSVGLLVFLLALVIVCTVRKLKKKNRGINENQKDNLELPSFDLITVGSATGNFCHTNKIGEGGFGPVYKGKLVGGQEIAVKRLLKDSGQGLAELMSEVILIAKLQHRNLVRLLGCCIQGEEKMLVYENMPNKSLDYFIFDKSRSKLLFWRQRYDIILGIARGLLYLHQDSRLRIIHRDLKASNILLDKEMEPKISDFGSARICGTDRNVSTTQRVVGTYGYMSPEYSIDGHFSVKSDVFSFGVLVLEVISGKRNRGFYHSDHHHNLLGHAWMQWNERNVLTVMDECLEDSCNLSEVVRCIHVGLLCVQQLPEDRPNMSSVICMLATETASLPEPKQPGYFTERCPFDSSSGDSHSENLLTITSLEAR